MKVCFETFGCRLNRAEALQMEAEYLAQGWELTNSHSDADLFVVRGCSVTRRAQRDCERLIVHLRKRYPDIPLRICGCLEKERWKTDAPDSEAEGLKGSRDGERPVPTRTARAYLKCQDGCSGKCTFCIVPQFRGPSVSVPFTELTDHARRFIDAGYREIVLTGCNLALYASEGKRLPDLVAALAELGNQNLETASCRLRLGSLEPGACALETVDAMAEHENVCRFLHIPIQSGSNAILMAMRRPYRVQDVDELVYRAVGKMPFAGLGCDMMCGFPGELKMAHMSSVGLLRRHAFSNVHVFPYSERPRTIAAGFPGAVPHDIRHARARELSAIATRSREKFARKFLGREVEVVIEDAEDLSGWTGEYFACEIANTGQAEVHRKDLVRGLVTEVRADRLKAVRVRGSSACCTSTSPADGDGSRPPAAPSSPA